MPSLHTTEEERENVRSNPDVPVAFGDVVHLIDDVEALLEENARLRRIAATTQDRLDHFLGVAAHETVCRLVAEADLEAALVAGLAEAERLRVVVKAATDYVARKDMLGELYYEGQLEEAVRAHHRQGQGDADPT